MAFLSLSALMVLLPLPLSNFMVCTLVYLHFDDLYFCLSLHFDGTAFLHFDGTVTPSLSTSMVLFSTPASLHLDGLYPCPSLHFDGTVTSALSASRVLFNTL